MLLTALIGLLILVALAIICVYILHDKVHKVYRELAKIEAILHREEVRKMAKR